MSRPAVISALEAPGAGKEGKIGGVITWEEVVGILSGRLRQDFQTCALLILKFLKLILVIVGAAAADSVGSFIRSCLPRSSNTA